ncbi:hypothetical protein NDU88_008635 [Pleurodeles waltl]|uniref:Uncharacterized protein n=1 Tax=Pleurodeles waltl TaxID=8319 RepID=A0AAV7PPQ3_PLEWA|nr:hypothetical protein NDU88_008635 [Pleurodeles waltl]
MRGLRSLRSSDRVILEQPQSSVTAGVGGFTVSSRPTKNPSVLLWGDRALNAAQITKRTLRALERAKERPLVDPT